MSDLGELERHFSELRRTAAGIQLIGEVSDRLRARVMATGELMATRLGAALGEDVDYHAVTPAQFRSFGFPGAEDLGNMFQYKHDFEPEFCAARDPAVARALNPELQTFEDWLARHKAEIPVA